MRWSQVALLWVVFAALAGEYLLVERPQMPGPSLDGDRPGRRRFLELQPDDVREVRLERRGRTIVSRRRDGRWLVVEPAGTTIPTDLIAAFTSALMGAEEIERLPGQLDPHAAGLDEQAARVEILAGDGAPVVVTLGAPNPTGTAIYARRAGAPEVVLIGRNIRYYEDLIFEALPAPRVPADDGHLPVGG